MLFILHVSVIIVHLNSYRMSCATYVQDMLPDSLIISINFLPHAPLSTRCCATTNKDYYYIYNLDVFTFYFLFDRNDRMDGLIKDMK